MTTDVIIPVYGKEVLTFNLLGLIGKSNPKPRTVILIDQQPKESTPVVIKKLAKDCSIKYIPLPWNIGVNAAWNLGLALAQAPSVTFMNNDLLIPEFLFGSIAAAFSQQPGIGYLVPHTIQSQDAVFLKKPPDKLLLAPLLRRQGWCFSMQREIALDIGWVPSLFHTFFGDDWFFKGCIDRNLITGVMVDVPIYHFGSSTLKDTGLEHTLLKKERKIWALMVAGE